MARDGSRWLSLALGALLVGAIAAACGSEDAHKVALASGGAGAGGEAGAPGSGGSNATQLGGDAGQLSAPAGGAPTQSGGGQGAAADGGSGGEGSQLVACGSDAGLTVVAGFRVDVLSAGDRLVQPNAMVFGSDGKLYVANSHSLIAGVGDQGEILVVAANGAQSVFATDDLMRGPDGVAFGTPAKPGELGALLVAVEDQVEAGLRTTDALLRVDAGKVSSFVDADEPASLLRGPGGAFGSDLYYTARTNLTGGPPNELRLFHLNDGGVASVFKVSSAAEPSAEIVGANVFTWGAGGTLGTDLYLSTVADLPYSPGSVDAIFRVDAAGAGSLLTSFRAAGLAASPAAAGQYGDYLYALGAASLNRIDGAGNVTPLVQGLSQPSGLVFGPAGELYVADTGAQRILTVRPCAP